MSIAAHLDFETAAPGELKKQGVHRQMEHPAARVWCFSWRIGDKGLVQRWHPGAADPTPLLAHIAAGGKVVAHNAAFELTVWAMLRSRLVPHWPELHLEQTDCTMARCLALAIPGGLDIAAEALGLTQRKDKEGGTLMMRMAKPRKRVPCPWCGGDGCPECQGCGEVFSWWDDAGRIERLGSYCDQDVITETAVDAALPPLSARERRVWEWDQRMNSRGVMLDIPLVERADAVVAVAKRHLDKQMAALTGGAVKKCSEAKKLVAWIGTFGVPAESVAKAVQEDLIALASLFDAPACPDDPAMNVVEKAIRLRQSAGKTSTAKFKAMLDCVCADGRARGQLQYHGASTGRWAGRLIQFQNLPRVDEERDGDKVRATLTILQRHANPDAAHAQLAAKVGEPMAWLSRAVRSMLIARPGHRYVGGDLSNIEGCVNAWISGEHWKVQAYHDNFRDPKTYPGLYELAYSRSFGEPVETVKGAKRQIGKVQELALGYQGAVGAFISMGQNYGIKPRDVVGSVREATDAETWGRTRLKAERLGPAKRHLLPVEEWTALRVITDRWRAAHPNITQAWWGLQDAAIDATASPGRVVPVLDGRVRYLAQRGFLWCALPSGRALAYCRPRVREVVEEGIDRNGDPYERVKRVVEYDGYNGMKKVWGKQTLYGGMQHENIVQAVARDVLVDVGLAAEAAGYPIVLTVHDELLAEVPVGHGSADGLKAIMSTVPAWCAGLPLAAKAWEDTRYAK